MAESRSRPIGVTILALLAALGALVAIYHTLQYLGLFPISGPFGVFSFFAFNLLGAFMWAILAAIYIWLVRKLWNVEAEAWLFLVILSILNLSLAVVSLLGASTLEELLPSLVVNGIILIYCFLPGVRDAFGTTQQAMSSPPPPAAGDSGGSMGGDAGGSMGGDGESAA